MKDKKQRKQYDRAMIQHKAWATLEEHVLTSTLYATGI